MARTQTLKTDIQTELANGFLMKHYATEISPGLLLGMDFDLIAYSTIDRVLWACEITTSGFLGKGKSNFHVGASRKFCEVFAKFSILNIRQSEAREHICQVTSNPGLSEARIHCRFVVPTGSRFIQALGSRHQLADTIMRIEEIDLSQSSRETMIEILLNARREQQKAAVSE